MKVAVESIGSFQRKLSITFPANKVKSELDTAFKRMGTRARLPGFRPGKVPRKVLEARFGGDIRADVANNLIQRGYSQAVTKESLEPVGQPNLDEAGEVQANADFVFTVTVDVKPTVELTKVQGVDVHFPPVDVSDEEVDGQVKRKLEGSAKLVEVDGRGIESGDMAMIELTVKDGDDVVASEPGTMIRTEADPYYAGLESFLVGVKNGKSKKGKVQFSAEARTEAVAGKELDVEVKVLSIQANEVPELTDELAEELGYEGGAKGMREALKAQIVKAREEMARNQARANLLEALIAANPFDVPGGMVESSLKMLMDELRLQQAYMGRDPRSLSFSDAQIADLRMRAAFAAKAGLILEKVSTDEKIEIGDADLEGKFQEFADERGQSLEAVRGHFMKDENQKNELKARMLEEKTLDWLLERANLVDAPAAPAVEAAPAAEEKKPAKKAKAKKAAKKEEPKADAGGADLSILKGAVGKVKDAINTGDHDAHLAEILAAEQDGKARKGAIAAIEKRIAEIG